MASGPITSWQIVGETMETVRDFIFLVSKITTDGDCSHEIKRHLLLGRKAMTNLDSIFKSRDLLCQQRYSQNCGFSIALYGCESWTVKKAEHQKTDAFEQWCWRGLLRVSWTARRLNLSILKEISPEYSLKGLDAEAEDPKLLPPDEKNWLIWKDPDSGKDLRQEEKGMTEDEMVGWHHWLNGHEFEQAWSVGNEQGSLACCSPWGCKASNTTEWLSWTDLVLYYLDEWAHLCEWNFD